MRLRRANHISPRPRLTQPPPPPAGFLQLLSQLTQVGDYDEATFKARFAQLQALPDFYTTVVIEGASVAFLSIFLEIKFYTVLTLFLRSVRFRCG